MKTYTKKEKIFLALYFFSVGLRLAELYKDYQALKIDKETTKQLIAETEETTKQLIAETERVKQEAEDPRLKLREAMLRSSVPSSTFLPHQRGGES